MSEDRKTLEQRAQMTDIGARFAIPAAARMATAIAKLWPDAQFAAGPPVETGFYYDMELQHRISPEDFPKIEEEMKKVVKADQVFEKVGGVPGREAGAGGCQSGAGARGFGRAIRSEQIQTRYRPGHSCERTDLYFI